MHGLNRDTGTGYASCYHFSGHWNHRCRWDQRGNIQWKGKSDKHKSLSNFNVSSMKRRQESSSGVNRKQRIACTSKSQKREELGRWVVNSVRCWWQTRWEEVWGSSAGRWLLSIMRSFFHRVMGASWGKACLKWRWKETWDFHSAVTDDLSVFKASEWVPLLALLITLLL